MESPWVRHEFPAKMTILATGVPHTYMCTEGNDYIDINNVFVIDFFFHH